MSCGKASFEPDAGVKAFSIRGRLLAPVETVSDACLRFGFLDGTDDA